MNKTIASRFFGATSALIMASIAILGITFMIFANQYFELERLNILSMCVESVEDNLEVNYQRHVGRISDVDPLRENLQLISDTTQSTVLIVDAQGDYLTCTDEHSCVHLSTDIPAESLATISVENTAIRVSDSFSKLYGSEMYAVGKAMRDDMGEITGYVFASSSAGTISIFTNALLSMFMLSACVMILISSIVSLAVTGRLTTPLRNITEVARRFSQGDFSARAVVEGDDEVAHLANTFNQMAAFVEYNETSRSNFVTNIAHELRTPMTSIKGFVDGIIDGTIPPEKQDAYLKIVSDEVGRLARLTNSMLDISKLDSGEFILNVANYNIWETISAVAFAFEGRIEDAEIQVQGFEPQRVKVLADKDIVHQVVYNIVDNALKFTPNGGTITFNVTEDKQGGYVTVKIRNSGMGIAKEALPYVFERFYKADASRSVHTKGAGIGLYIAKTLVQRSGGDIHVESVEGEYTEFIFTLPSGEKAEKAKKPKPDKGEKALKIREEKAQRARNRGKKQ
ncbi:MAG: HAMP domain-containing histidine kinase [Oscillospiraceae bacterium]|nr:HAMP domain-containing histidine kinase [Oscillospiraceae bacterium]